MKFRQAIFILIILLFLAIIHLFIYTQNITLKFKITDLKIKFSQIRSKNRSLASEVARKENLKEIEKIAKERLGMIYPEKIIYLLPSKEGETNP